VLIFSLLRGRSFVVSGARFEQLDGVSRRVREQGGVDRDAGSYPLAERDAAGAECGDGRIQV
jgi:hypothetical protein